MCFSDVNFVICTYCVPLYSLKVEIHRIRFMEPLCSQRGFVREVPMHAHSLSQYGIPSFHEEKEEIQPYYSNVNPNKLGLSLCLGKTFSPLLSLEQPNTQVWFSNKA